jgi:autophagy-related protein 5
MSPSLEACKTNFMNQLKEADYVRWGSVRRVTSLRRVDQDALWEGVVGGGFKTGPISGSR